MTYSTFGYCGYLDNLTLLGTIDLLNIEKDKIIGQPSGITITKTYSCDAIVRKTSESVQQRKSSTDRSLLNINASNEYDARDRVTKLTDSLGNESIKLSDGNGLLWSVSHRYKKADGTYLICSNRLQDIRIGSVAGTLEASFFHNDEGRLTNQTGPNAKALTWDAKGRVKAVSGETYTYDPMDYRIGRTGGSVGAREYFLEGERLESEYSGTSLQAKYFRGSTVDELVGAWMTDADGKLKPFLFHQDQVTSTSAVTGHNGGTTQSVKYAAFGTVQSSTGASPNRNKYTGREDDGTGLMYYRARYYDSSVGRFISEDPMGYAAGINFYAYVSNNPVNGNDPSGNEPVIVRSGNNFDITFRNVQVVVQPPLKPSLADSAMSNVSNIWSGSFPPYQSTARVNYQVVSQFSTNTDPSRIEVTIAAGSPTVGSWARQSYAGKPAEASLNATSMRANTPAHEFGHLLGLNHPWGATDEPPANWVYTRNIMDYVPRSSGVDNRAVSALNFNDLVRNSGTGVPINTAPMRDESSSSFDGASGGFLLYPNKSNSNMTRAVYAK
jgi:RHS repeat-associated protein